ncbi:MAG: LemA family protein [Planctomycetaceae bacterium]
MEPALLVILVVPLIGLIWFIAGFNALVRLRNHCRESWSNIDTELKRRYDLIPNLVNTVKGYAAHEQELFERVTQARNAAQQSHGSPASQAADENVLVRGVRQLFAVAESYPDLKASKNFLALQEELSHTEDRIQRARRFYNANVRDLNTRIEVVPSNIIASLFNFQKEEYFEVEDAIIREAPTVTM